MPIIRLIEHGSRLLKLKENTHQREKNKLVCYTKLYWYFLEAIIAPQTSNLKPLTIKFKF